MAELIQSVLFLSGGLTVLCLLILPLLFLVAISVCYVVAELFGRFRHKRGLF